jgi:hypothetical protein
MWARRVVMVHELVHEVIEMPFAEHDEVVEALIVLFRNHVTG